MPKPDRADLQALGVYDPDDPHAEQTLELLEFLLELGASREDLADFRDQLAGLPSVLAMRGGPALTLAQVAERSGVAEERLLRIAAAAGLPRPGAGDRAFIDAFGAVAAAMEAAEEVFGEDSVLALIRVMGSSMARLADAIVSAFLVNVEPADSEKDPVGLRVAQANAAAGPLIPGLAAALDVLLRQHLLLARRSSLGAAAEGGYEKRHMCVGFVDLVGSTSLAQVGSASALGQALREFERVCSEVVTAAGGRVVKLIGDEVMFTTASARPACEIALELAGHFSAHPAVPPVRAGLASGEVMLRDGDVFGRVVSLAARAVGVAGPGEVLAPAELAAEADVPARALAPRELKGFQEPVELCLLSPTA